MKKQYTQKLLDYLYAAPTPFQSVEVLAKTLDSAGATRLDELAKWELEKGKLYYFIKDGSQILAFKIGTKPLAENGFRIVAAHHDAPGFRIKPVASTVDGGIERISIEPYGGLIVHGWLDRPLAVAGRICVKTPQGIRAININICKPIMIIPSVAIHIQRDVNEGAKFNVQTEMCPFFALSQDGKTNFLKYIADYAGVAQEDILSYELAPYDYQPGCFVGANEEFASIGRMDDAASAHAAFTALLEAADSENTCIAVAYDHEECGSNSTRGARSNSLKMTIGRICEAFGLTAEERYRATSGSLLYSSDSAHAWHPGYAGKYDPQNQAKLNGGPVLKLTHYQSYATSSRGTAVFKYICEANDVPYQVFTNRSDARGGGTIGPGMAAEFGMTTVDVGNPILSMHAIRELCGCDDHYYMTKMFAAMYRSNLSDLLC
ncbi:MAG: M18 family aminopeptidase [Clostridia bacterium]|nr:M18 family aminopeptidase [Clostridia bacterium]